MELPHLTVDRRVYEFFRWLLIVIWTPLSVVYSILAPPIFILWWYIVLPALVFLIVPRFAESITSFFVWTCLRISAIRAPLRLRQRLLNFATWLRNAATALRYNSVTDGIHLRYQQVIFFIGEHKALLFSFLLVFWLGCNHTERYSSTSHEIFVRLSEIQRHCPDCSVPAHVVKPKFEYGSNSHYIRQSDEAIDNDRWDEAISPSQSSEKRQTRATSRDSVDDRISADYAAFKASQSKTASFTRPQESEKVRRSVGKRNVWCRECEQWHCCELPY